MTELLQECTQNSPKYHGDQMNSVGKHKGQTDVHSLFYR